MRESLPRRWCVAINEESIKVIGPYYSEKASRCYLNPSKDNDWKYYVSHDTSGTCITEGSVQANFARSSLPTDHELITLEEFKHLVLEQPQDFPKHWYINITSENFDEVGKWRKDGEFHSFSKREARGYCESPYGWYGIGSAPSDPKYKKISTEDFRKFVLGKRAPEPPTVQKQQAQPRVERSNIIIIPVPKI